MSLKGVAIVGTGMRVVHLEVASRGGETGQAYAFARDPVSLPNSFWLPSSRVCAEPGQEMPGHVSSVPGKSAYYEHDPSRDQTLAAPLCDRSGSETHSRRGRLMRHTTYA